MDKCRKIIGVSLMLILLAACYLVVRIYYPEFYEHTVVLTLAGDIDGLSAYISSFGYGAFVVSILLLVVCNILGIPTIPFLTVNGALFGLIPGIIISWLGEVAGIEISFCIGRIFFRKEARYFLARRQMLKKLDKYSTVRAMALARAIPYSPNVLFTAVAVLSKLTPKQHLKANIIGKLPSVIIEVWLGHDLIRITEHWLRFTILTLLLIGGSLGWKWYKKKHPKGTDFY